MRELSICYDLFGSQPYVPLPSILYTCKSLMTLELEGQTILVDICDPPSTKHVIVAPSIKYFKIEDEGDDSSVKHLSLRQLFNGVDESMFTVGIVFNQLEHFKVCIHSENCSTLLLWLLRYSPKLTVLNLYVDDDNQDFYGYYRLTGRTALWLLPIGSQTVLRLQAADRGTRAVAVGIASDSDVNGKLRLSRIRNALGLELIRWTRAGTPCRNKRHDRG
ncbi:hypothetical protein DY000_02058685 [Brassica cretica]|uniref:F-box associated domain-containing protein n=1 Tax=Brassica cretica TaxID=69181 RepID=A0ABQ7AYY5_BRACR|nr:hypothetical protein DY000_02058685 [Brassica cretica]